MPSKAEIQARMALDTKPFASELKRSRKDAKTAGASIMRSLGPVAGALGFAGIANKAMSAAREIETLSEVANASTEEFQKLSFAAKSVNVETKKLADIYKDTQDKVGDFLKTGGGPLKDFFEQIAPQVGVTAEMFRDLSGPDALQLYYDSVDKANVSQSEMVFYMEAIASDATNLIPLLKEGGAEFERMGNKAQIMGEKSVKALSDAKSNLEGLERNLTISAGSAMGWANDLVEVTTLMALSAVEGRNHFALLGEAEADAEHHAKIMTRTREAQARAEEKAARKLAEYNDLVRRHIEYQEAAAQAVLDRAEAERQLAAEFKRSVAEYVTDAELEALKTRASGDAAAADAQEERVKKMKQAVAFSNKYNISLEEAAQLVQRLADAEASRAEESEREQPGKSEQIESSILKTDTRQRGRDDAETLHGRDLLAAANAKGQDTNSRFQALADGTFQRYTAGKKGGVFTAAQLQSGLGGGAAAPSAAERDARQDMGKSLIDLKGESLRALRSIAAELTDTTPARES